jgi:leucyl-tRNA synthetase
MNLLDFERIEKKWQRKWEREKVFEVREGGRKKKYYVLEQYPYPSGSGLHMGHSFIYTLGDIQARLKRMQGFNVLHPIGFDSFGLPAENAAIKSKSHPKKFTEDAIKNFTKQMKSFGYSYDWSRVIMSHSPDFYRWNQWIFLKMFERGLAYRKKAPVNWCRECKTVIANEQVVNGKCWRHEDCDVEIKHLEQWFFKITEYAEELLDNLNDLDDWPDRIKKLQRNWIGRSEGTEVDFLIDGKKWPVFTTRVDTLFGVTFLVVSAQHPDLMSLVSAEQRGEVEKLLKKIRSTKEEDLDKLEKEGVFTGAYAEHPLTGEKIQIWTGNFVVADYGSGMVMAVPAHDERDWVFAKKYKLKIKEVVKGEMKNDDIFTGYGILVNSEGFDGLKSEEAKEHITNALAMKKLGRKKVEYRLKDWLFSRQRFWGTPIPIIYCDDCGEVPVPEKDLPVRLPDNVKFETEKSPLSSYEKFVNAKCPRCGKRGRRETDTMDGFVDSSWYFLRYCDPGNKSNIFDGKKVNYWMPIDIYVGGKEHAVMHDIYFRFFTMFLRDLKLLGYGEPALKLFVQGVIHGSDGRKMSKSYGNVILPEVAAKKYGVDATRMFLVSVASPDKDFSWNDKGAEGSLRFVMRVVKFVDGFREVRLSKLAESKLNRAVQDYSSDLEGFRYNLAVIKLRELFGVLESGCDRKSLEVFLKLLSPICPHIAEEMWGKISGKGFISLAQWPKFDVKKIDDKLEEEEKQAVKVVDDIKYILKLMEEKQKKKGKKVFVYVLPQEKRNYSGKVIGKELGLEVKVFAVNDKDKYDPEEKSKKVKPGRPGIFVE